MELSDEMEHKTFTIEYSTLEEIICLENGFRKTMGQCDKQVVLHQFDFHNFKYNKNILILHALTYYNFHNI